MFHTLAQLKTIGRNTFIESIRQPIFTVLIVIATLLLVMNISISAYTMDDDNKLLIDIGLSTLLMIGLLLAAFTATGVLSQEIENKTVLTVVSKPVARPVFVLGKFLGVAVALVMGFWIMTAIFLLTVRHGVMQTAGDMFDMPVIIFGVGGALAALLIATLGNYLYQMVFTSALMVWLAIAETVALVLVSFIQKSWQFQFFKVGDPQILLGILLVFMGLMVISAVAIAASTRLGQIMTLVVCTGVFILGILDDVMSKSGWKILGTLGRVIPNIQYFWPADEITQQQTIHTNLVLWSAAYAALFIAAFLSLAVALFQTREVG